jgi:hypothetical protein
MGYNKGMETWSILFYEEFRLEFEGFSKKVRLELLASLVSLEKTGPQLGRPLVDTLNGSRHQNMKELRFKADDGVWRVAFAFDPTRAAILLVAGDKSGGSQKRFYKQLIEKADKRFDIHLLSLKKEAGHD